MKTLGRSYWQVYLQINGYAACPSEAGLDILARRLDLNKRFLTRCIYFFLTGN